MSTLNRHKRHFRRKTSRKQLKRFSPIRANGFTTLLQLLPSLTQSLRTLHTHINNKQPARLFAAMHTCNGASAGPARIRSGSLCTWRRRGRAPTARRPGCSSWRWMRGRCAPRPLPTTRPTHFPPRCPPPNAVCCCPARVDRRKKKR